MAHRHVPSEDAETDELGSMTVDVYAIWASLCEGRTLKLRCQGCEQLLRVDLRVLPI